MEILTVLFILKLNCKEISMGLGGMGYFTLLTKLGHVLLLKNFKSVLPGRNEPCDYASVI